MAMIDLSFLTTKVSELNFFFTNLARSEQMKDVVDKKEFTEDVSSTTVSITYSDESITLELNTNDNNKTHVWKENFYIMAKTLLPQKIREIVSFYKDEIIEQIKPILIGRLAGGYAQ